MSNTETLQSPLSPELLPLGRFAAKTVSSGSLILITLEKKAGNMAHLTINSEKMLIGTMLVKDIIHSLTQ